MNELHKEIDTFAAKTSATIPPLIRPALVTPNAPLADQITTYERLRGEMRERVRKQSLTNLADYDRRYMELKTEFDRRMSDEITKIEQARVVAFKALFDEYARAKQDTEALLLRVEE